MSKTTDWLPGTRQGQLDMAQRWLEILPGKYTEWKIPIETVNTLSSVYSVAHAALQKAIGAGRTEEINAQCRAAFKDLVQTLRDIKRRYLFCPPLLESDLIALGLKLRDTKPTESGEPTAQTIMEIHLEGFHELGFTIVYLTGDPKETANKSYRIWYSVIPQGEAIPTSPNQLSHSFTTQRKKDEIKFEYEDSGKIAVMAVQVENGKKKGPWGPMVTAVIP